MKIISLIPARSGSKGLKHKNIKKIGRHSLIGLAINCSKNSKYIKRTVLSTDSNFYASIGKKYGADVPFLRPKKISSSNTKDISVVKHMIMQLNLHNKQSEKCIIIYLRPSSPFRNTKILDKAINVFLKNYKKYDSLRSVSEMSESAFKTFVIKSNNLRSLSNENNYLESSNLPRQKAKKTFTGNGIIDIYKLSFILKHKKLHGKNVYPFITDQYPEIDNQNDFSYVKYLFKKRRLI